jgi:hypothetical protein
MASSSWPDQAGERAREAEHVGAPAGGARGGGRLITLVAIPVVVVAVAFAAKRIVPVVVVVA